MGKFSIFVLKVTLAVKAAEIDDLNRFVSWLAKSPAFRKLPLMQKLENVLLRLRQDINQAVCKLLQISLQTAGVERQISKYEEDYCEILRFPSVG